MGHPLRRRTAFGGILALAATLGCAHLQPSHAQSAKPANPKKTEKAAPAPGPDITEKIALCKACHGDDGKSANPAIPTIGGQPKLFVMYQLFFFREGRRASPEMNEAAKGLTDRELDAISEWVARLPAPVADKEGLEAERMAKGEEISRARHCGSCHNPDYSGREQMPRLAGQREGYLVKAFQEYRAGSRVGTQAAMAEAVRGLSDEDMQNLAHYLARMP